MKQYPSSQNDKLFQALLALGKKAIDKIIQHRDENNLKALPYQYLPVSEIDFHAESYYFDWDKIEYFDSYDWHFQDFANFLDEELLVLPEFEEAAQKVIEEFKIPEVAVKKIGLFKFLREIMNKSPNGRITHDNVAKYVQLFIDGYESYRSHIPIVWNVHL
ncbi:MAG: hypothetical protein IPN76_17730 [Saprospiraceae bacterium]|nr:hypothetical protein [Saprospiraceae bacterium]